MNNDPFTIWFDIGRQAMAAQEAQAKAMQQALHAWGKGIDAQRAMTRASEANLAAMKGWMALWGIR